MRSRIVFKIGFIFALVFVVLMSYFWYLYFNEENLKELGPNKNLEFISGSNTNYINAKVDDTDEAIPTYYFRVRNHGDADVNYDVILKKTIVNDGCDNSTTFSLSDLNYEFKLNGLVIKSGLLSDIQNGILDNSTLKKESTNDYSLRIWLNKDNKDYQNKHFHYVINIEEKYENK